MAIVTMSGKSVAVNPLKQSQPLGAALAFLGLRGTIPLFHGSQGCTAFAKVVLVRHFREAIPLATTAMSEVSTILGGEENIEQAIAAIIAKNQPELIGLLTTGLTETRGDDMAGILQRIRNRHPELAELPIVSVSTPDFKGALQDGFAAAVTAVVKQLPESGEVRPQQVTVLVGSASGPGDIQEIKEIIADFGLRAIVTPDLSTSLDGHLAQAYQTVSSGGTSVEQLRAIGCSSHTLALGESMRPAAMALQDRFGTPVTVFPGLSSLGAIDQFFMTLAELSGQPVPHKYRYQRTQLQDAMLDTHFFFGRKQVALALEPDLLWAIIQFFQSMGSQVQTAVTTTKSPLLEQLPVDRVTIGDLEDFEQQARGADLLVGNSHLGAIARRWQTPLYRLGFPVFDRLGNGQRCIVGYRGMMQLLFEVGNLFLEKELLLANH